MQHGDGYWNFDSRMKKINLTHLDPVTKIVILLFTITIFYFSLFSLMKPFFITQPTPMMQIMSQMIGSDILNFSRESSSVMNLIALMGALLIGIIVSLYLFQSKTVDMMSSSKNEYAILRKALSPDEQAILDEIEKAGEITQDSLRFRLNWSKAKVSTILTNLDKMNLIQRERVGKTYKVYFTLSEKEQFKTV